MMPRGRRNSKSQMIGCAWFLVDYVKLSRFIRMVWFSMVLKRGGRRIEEGRKRGVFWQANLSTKIRKRHSSDKRVGNVTPWRCLARHSEQAHSALTLYNVEVCFIPFCLHFASTLRSEARAKAERRQGEGRVEALCGPKVYYIIPQKPKIRVPLLRKKKWDKTTLDDNYNYNRYEPLFTPHFTNCRANTMTDSYIHSTVHCSLWNAMNFGFLRGL